MGTTHTSIHIPHEIITIWGKQNPGDTIRPLFATACPEIAGAFAMSYELDYPLSTAEIWFGNECHERRVGRSHGPARSKLPAEAIRAFAAEFNMHTLRTGSPTLATRYAPARTIPPAPGNETDPHEIPVYTRAMRQRNTRQAIY